MAENTKSAAYAYARLFGGRWLSAINVGTDGVIREWYGSEIVDHELTLDTLVYTGAEITRQLRRLQAAGSHLSPRLAVVNGTGMTLPVESGKGACTLRELIVRRCGDQAEQIIAAFEAQVELDQAA